MGIIISNYKDPHSPTGIMESRRVIFVVQMWCPLFLAFVLPVILFCPNACSVFVALVPLQALWSTVVLRKKLKVGKIFLEHVGGGLQLYDFRHLKHHAMFW